VLERLEQALEEGGRVALSALESLTRIGGEAVHMAGRLLQSDDPELVRAAVECLGRHAGPAWIPELFPLLAHAEWSVRAEVARVLSERADERAVPPLLRRLEVESDEFVRTAIMGALARLEC
jgi:HEAT repeat protein